ncbi:MAG: hypothetical protein GTO45_04665 [Candidatus Aminicenantes bacterium]|nr:hypothetical protein [Candidatus Aminicenantes bacterium]NIM78046.1 hypothetical protein [Candidatus Aminicenantes bacterium]NIN17363.1 hypothetical protein [Candidatus Aminicenantes bacterium]NIN41256.1 hypothetical protein [Candidatus Aminicenantes bacterium]NIN84029.1 hypothetical protein [Candidatus Aminicenantes bacterium]
MDRHLFPTRLKSILIVMVVFASIWGMFGLCLWSQEHKPLEYEVSVKALPVPFVAVDAYGNPVYDLKRDELELYINRKLTKIIYLYGISFGDAEVSREKDEEQKPPPVEVAAVRKFPAKEVTRLKFIIVDALFNSYVGLKHAKMVARQLIENGAPQDRFILLEITLGGLKYIAGPEPGSKEFLEHLDKLKTNPQKLLWWERRYSFGFRGLRYERLMMDDGLKCARRDTVNMYLNAFEQFKNALLTIDNPKVTYLLSEDFYEHCEDGFMKYFPWQHTIYSYLGFEGYMENQVYDGGSVLERISVRGLRRHHVRPLVKWLNRSASAYYELFFNPSADLGKQMKIEIKCKRKGVRIKAAAHKERDKPYQKMSQVRKKLFAISVAADRSWSRVLGRVQRSPYETLNVKKIGDETHVTVHVPIPEKMKNRSVDVFALRFDDQFMDADVTLENRRVTDSETITLPTEKNKKQLYFVIVDPTTAFCIFNKVLYEKDTGPKQPAEKINQDQILFL